MKRKKTETLTVRVHPQVKEIWDKLPEHKKKLLIRKLQMDIIGASNADIPEDALAAELRYDKESLKALKEVFEVAEGTLAYKELAKEAIAFVIALKNAASWYAPTTPCHELIEVNEEKYYALLNKARRLGIEF